MFMLNVILAFIGTISFMYGFLVCFKKKYNLVNAFARNAHAKDATYAEQIGLIALMSGMLFIFAGIVGFVSANLWVSVLLLTICGAITSSLLAHSTIKANRT